MQENFDPKAIEKIQELVNSGAGQQLLMLLQQTDPQALNTAIQQAGAGDYKKVSQTLSPLLQSKDIQTLLKQMEGR